MSMNSQVKWVGWFVLKCYPININLYFCTLSMSCACREASKTICTLLWILSCSTYPCFKLRTKISLVIRYSFSTFHSTFSEASSFQFSFFPEILVTRNIRVETATKDPDMDLQMIHLSGIYYTSFSWSSKVSTHCWLSLCCRFSSLRI